MEYTYIYILLINLITFIVFAMDKKKARRKQWRVPESTLLFLSLMGGGFGGLLSMYIFRHKTDKIKFVIIMPILFILNFLAFYYII